MEREVLHVNVTAFPVGVARAVDPSLRGRPVVIAVPNSTRAVALAVSREAYLEGVMKGMPVAVARKFCRGLRIIPPNEPLYRRASRALIERVSRYSPLVEPWRAGHIYLDITGTRKLFGAPMDTGARIQREIKESFSLRNTVGLASNKLVSRVASRIVRPRGLCDIFHGGEAAFLAPLDVDVLPGVGDKTLMTLADLNIRVVGELAATGPDNLFVAFGKHGYELHRAARGIDESPVRPPEKSPAINEEETLANDSNDDRVILGTLYALVEKAARKLRETAMLAGALKVEIIYSDHVSASGEGKMPEPSDLDGPLFAEAKRLLDKAWTRRIRLRYMSVTLKQLTRAGGAMQLNLFNRGETGTAIPAGVAVSVPGKTGTVTPRRNSPCFSRERPLVNALDAIRAKYGDGAVRLGRTL